MLSSEHSSGSTHHTENRKLYFLPSLTIQEEFTRGEAEVSVSSLKHHEMCVTHEEQHTNPPCSP